MMLRTVSRLSPSFILPFLEHRDAFDCDRINQPKPHTPKDGIERVKQLFTRNEYGEYPLELYNVFQTTFCGVFGGACFGGFIKSKDAYIRFVESNEATAFKSSIHAKKQLQDYVTIAFAKGAVHWGWRLGLFTGCFSLITTTAAVYRDKTSLIDYVFAGALTGAIYKANLGMAAMLVGAGVGTVFSTVGGLLILSILKATGLSMDDVRAILYKVKEAREDQYNQVLEKAATIKHDGLTKHHDELVTEKGTQKIDDID